MSASSHTRGHRYAPGAHVRGAGLARIARPPRGQQQPRAAARDEQDRPVCCARRIWHPHAANARRGRPPARRPRRKVFSRSVHHQAQPRRQRPRRAPLPGSCVVAALCRGRRLRRFRRRHHADPGIHPGAGARHHARRVRRRQVSVRGGSRHLARLRAVPGRRLPGGRRIFARWARRRRRATPRFRILENFRHPIVQKYQRFIGANGIGIAGIEFITDAPASSIPTTSTRTRTTTATRRSAGGLYGMRAIARYLGDESRRSAQASSRMPSP